jgi:DNA uptake protein ComE-like DNA-binding protein
MDMPFSRGLFPRALSVFAIAFLCGLTACAPNQNPQELKEQTARATAELKGDAKAVAAGVREGWSRDKPLNLNTATREQLLSLPGVTGGEADRVIAGRPYDDPGQLLTRRILSQTEYNHIADRLTAKK